MIVMAAVGVLAVTSVAWFFGAVDGTDSDDSAAATSPSAPSAYPVGGGGYGTGWNTGSGGDGYSAGTAPVGGGWAGSVPLGQTAAATPPTASTTPPTPTATALSAQQVVEDFFFEVNNDNIYDAWARLGGRNMVPSLAAFQAGYAQTRSVTCNVINVAGDRVTVVLDATQADGAVLRYRAVYVVDGGSIHSGQMTLLAASPSP